MILEPGTKIIHRDDLKIKGTVLDCINSSDVQDIQIQGHRYLVQSRSHSNRFKGIWSIPADKLRITNYEKSQTKNNVKITASKLLNSGARISLKHSKLNAILKGYTKIPPSLEIELSGVKDVLITSHLARLSNKINGAFKYYPKRLGRDASIFNITFDELKRVLDLVGVNKC